MIKNVIVAKNVSRETNKTDIGMKKRKRHVNSVEKEKNTPRGE